VWSADFKGHFKTGDGLYCYPLTIADGYSRLLLACQALHTTAVRAAKAVFARIFREYGLPQRIRTDNGVPFATVSLARLSTLSCRGWPTTERSTLDPEPPLTTLASRDDWRSLASVESATTLSVCGAGGKEKRPRYDVFLSVR
jgi:hypothetical protein